MACMDWHICVTSGEAAPFEVQQVAVEFWVERGQLIKHWPTALHTNPNIQPNTIILWTLCPLSADQTATAMRVPGNEKHMHYNKKVLSV